MWVLDVVHSHPVPWWEVMQTPIRAVLLFRFLPRVTTCPAEGVAACFLFGNGRGRHWDCCTRIQTRIGE